jgi:predicted nucleic acid-binding protein
LVPAPWTATPCTSASIFTLDTNVLVYSVDLTAGTRHEVAKQVVARARLCACCLTLQSVSEFYAVVTRKAVMRPVEAVPLANAMMDLFPTAAASASAVRTALRIASAGHASYWDALLLATAAEAGCIAVLTEDLANGTTLAGVRIVNPFAGDALSPDAEALLKSG